MESISNKLIKILLVDDHILLRNAVSLLLQEEDDLLVIGEVKSGEEATLLVKKLKPDIVVMDISMTKLNVIEVTNQLKCISSKSKVIALSIHPTLYFIEEIFDAGAAGYLFKEKLPEELIKAIHKVMDGNIYLSSIATYRAECPPYLLNK